MEIEGPLKYRIVSYENSSDREIHVDFKEKFQNLDLQQQASEFAQHINFLHSQISDLEEESQEREGMLFVLQFIEELAPHVQAGVIPLDETIIVKVQEQPPLSQLISGLQIN